MNLSIGLLILIACNQSPQNASIKDYYIPSLSNFNAAKYYTPGIMPGKTDDSTTLTSLTYYIENEDGTYYILHTSKVQNTLASADLQKVEFTRTEVKIIKQTIAGLVHPSNEYRIYEPSEVLLKIPQESQNITWTDPIDKETPTTYESSWTTVMFNGESRNAIKVVSKTSGFTTKLIYYYVQGIGLVNTDFVDEKGIVKPFTKFKEVSYEATAKETVNYIVELEKDR